MMNFGLLLHITSTHLLSRIRQTIIAALGVTFGIGGYITLVSFMTGLNGLLDGLILDRTPHVHLYNEIKISEEQPVDLYSQTQNAFNVVHSLKPKQAQARIHNALAILDHLNQQKEVVGATPQIKAQVFYISGAIELNGVVNGVDILAEAEQYNLDAYIIKGSPEALSKDPNGIILGIGVAKKLSLSLGDRVQIATVKNGIFPLKIVGFYQSGLAEIDNVQSYTNLSTAQRIMGEANNYVTDINIKLEDVNQAVPMAQKLHKLFGITAVDIVQANAQFETGTTIRNIITYAVSVTLLIVAGFGIYNILNMLIYEKMDDIAILKATGFSGKDVKRIFIYQAMIIGLIGGILGLIIGYGFSVIIDRTPFETEALPTIDTFPVNYNPAYYVIAIVFALISTFLAGYLPARRAEKIDPVEIIRGQ